MPRGLDVNEHLSAARSATRFPMPPEGAEGLLRQLSTGQDAGASPTARRVKRFGCSGSRSVLTVMHPGGSLAANECLLVDISDLGCGCLYAGFLHSESACVLHVEGIGGGVSSIPASTVWCRFVTRSIHMIGLAWDEPIDVRTFIASVAGPEQPIESSLPAEKSESVKRYISMLEGFAAQLSESVGSDDADAATRIAQSVQNTAEGFGFPVLEEAARLARTALVASASASESEAVIQTLIGVIGRLRPPGDGTPSDAARAA